MPYFSVVIPLYNKENFIQKTIDSILAQTFGDYEVIVVDDCSTDSSVAKVRAFESGKLRIVSHKKNKGLSASRNTGIDEAKAEFVTFLDADDVWKPHFLERIMELTTTFPQAHLFATSYEEAYHDNLVLKPSVNKNDLETGKMFLLNDFFTRNTQQPIYNHSSLCVRKTLFVAAGNYDESINFSEDVDFGIRANAHSALAFYNGAESVYNVYSENQITNSGIKGKTIPNLSKFTEMEKGSPELKKYIDFERYVLAKHCKLAGRKAEFKALVAEIDLKNLTGKQKLMLKFPKWALKSFQKLKVFFLLKGFRMTSY